MNMIRLLADVDMNSVLNNGMNFGERLADFGKMLLIGMACVFGVIFVIWLMLTVFRVVIYDIPNRRAKKEEETKKAPVTVPTPASDPVADVQPVTAGDDSVTVAVITAAIYAYLEANSEDGTVLPFRVVSFKRKKNGTPWNS